MKIFSGDHNSAAQVKIMSHLISVMSKTIALEAHESCCSNDKVSRSWWHINTGPGRTVQWQLPLVSEGSKLACTTNADGQHLLPAYLAKTAHTSITSLPAQNAALHHAVINTLNIMICALPAHHLWAPALSHACLQTF